MGLDMSLFIKDYGFHIIFIVLVGVISYIGIGIKSIISSYHRHFLEREKALMVYRAVNRLYPSLSFDDKMKMMISNLGSMMMEYNIRLTDLELRMLIYGNGDIKSGF